MTTKKTRREFTTEFKREAVVLLRDSGRPLTQVASELGLEPSVLRRWRSLANGAGQAAAVVRPGGAAVAASAEQVEIQFLRRELERAQMERDILKKLGRQSWLADLQFQFGQIGLWAAAEPGAQRPCVSALVEAVAQFAPRLPVGAAQLAPIGRAYAGRGGGDQTHLAAQHSGRRGRLAPRRAPLVVALGAEQLLKAVVGPRQARHGAAVEQPGAIAAGDLGKVVDGGRQRAGQILVPVHGPDQPVEAAADSGGVLTLVVAQHPRCRMHPGIGALHIRPERRRALQAAVDQLAQPRERCRKPPFTSTRSKLAATASSRALSFSPGAASGGRPSSVMALRTAAQ